MSFLVRGDVSALDMLFFSDEAWFHLDRYINIQNYRVWNSENTHIFRKMLLYPQKIGVFCDMSRRRVVAPIFFRQQLL